MLESYGRNKKEKREAPYGSFPLRGEAVGKWWRKQKLKSQG